MDKLSSSHRLPIVYMKQTVLFLSFNYPQRASTRRLDIVYIKQPLLFLSFNYPQPAV